MHFNGHFLNDYYRNKIKEINLIFVDVSFIIHTGKTAYYAFQWSFFNDYFACKKSLVSYQEKTESINSRLMLSFV